MAQMYQPCTLRLRLENAIAADANDSTVSLCKDNRQQLTTSVYVDPATGILHITPCFNWVELTDYSIVFSKMMRFAGGRLFLRNYALPFQIRAGVFYSRNGMNASRTGELFVPQNIMRHTGLISARFDESKCWITLDYIDDSPKEDEDPEEQ